MVVQENEFHFSRNMLLAGFVILEEILRCGSGLELMKAIKISKYVRLIKQLLITFNAGGRMDTIVLFGCRFDFCSA